ncbi:Uma2 family endonuclease [Phormidium sp. CCY1219]|uniref:Uma2 family endonuclease n=1 Tax=Phormidium sp. CCY1219 TaxID=2886104 RepID=UPI003FA70DC6
MTGGTPNHNRIAGNLYAALDFALKLQPYDVFFTDRRLWIPRKRIYTYPDVMVVRGDLQLQEGRRDTITNPLVIAEILSESTRSYDKDKKFAAYRRIPNFQEYLVIDQYRIQVEQYVKSDRKRWMFVEYDATDESICLNAIDFQIALEDLYDKVELDTAEDAGE